MADSTDKPRSLIDNVAALVGIVGSVITIVLTVQNNETKREIDQQQQELQVRSQKLQEAAQALEAEIKRRTTTVEEAREKVDRYKWVYTLVPNLSDQKNPANRSTALAMIRLALDRQDADVLLAGLTQSSDVALQKGAEEGQQTLQRIESSELKALVGQIDASALDARRAATAKLERDYASSATAVGLVLERLADGKAGRLSPQGLVNALYFLTKSQKSAWPPENQAAFEAMRANLGQTATGAQAQALFSKLVQQVTVFRS